MDSKTRISYSSRLTLSPDFIHDVQNRRRLNSPHTSTEAVVRILQELSDSGKDIKEPLSLSAEFLEEFAGEE